MAPALTAFADKDTSSFDFTHIEGNHSRQNWVREHFLKPTKVTPGSPMRIYAMNREQIEALTSYVLSLSEKVFPPRLLRQKIVAFFLEGESIRR